MRPVAWVGLVLGILLVLLGLIGALPGLLSTAEQLCADSPTPRLCRALERAAGAPDLAAVDLGSHPPDLSSMQPLVAGGEALRAGWPALAYRRCEEAFRQAQGDASRGAALICQGRAALVLGWPAKALYLGQRARDLYEDAPALTLIGDAHQAQGECVKARPLFLKALELSPGYPGAVEGLRRCLADPPAPRPPAAADLSMIRAGLGAGSAPTLSLGTDSVPTLLLAVSHAGG